MIPVYDSSQSWQWNLQNAPDPDPQQPIPGIPECPGNWTWCGLPVASPLGIPAGPLLNGKWINYYARLGFDILVYKTVRSSARDCYPLPNLVAVESGQLTLPGIQVPESPTMQGSWAVSFGMPSQSPEIWREDVRNTRDRLPEGKVLVVSVVGTQDTSLSDPQQSLDALADDFAKCARWAVNSGAHGIEANFSCPNVSTADGQLFQNPQLAAIVAQRIRDAIGDAPLVIKIGKVNSAEEAAALVDALSPFINGLAMTNSISATVVRPDGTLHFDGQPRGICGDATRTASIGQTQLFADVVRQQSLPLDLIGVGGISTAAHVQDYLNAGATSVAMATSAMINPLVAFSIRGEMASHASQLQ